jgi:hypothetical protein
VLACWQGTSGIVGVLLENGANPNRKMWLSDLLLLRELKLAGPIRSSPQQNNRRVSTASNTSPSSNSGSRNVSLGSPNVLNSPGLNFNHLKQSGHFGPVIFSEQYRKEMFLLPFEQALANGNVDVARQVLSKYPC